MDNVPKDSNLFTRLIKGGHVPDILDCIANLSSDEVFTPPELVDKMLDLLPEEVWHDKNLKWLDPGCKTGIFLRQIATRLMNGLKGDFPDEEERRQHIFKNMLYGFALTDLTALMSRRSLYTSKYANGEKSIAHFNNAGGNIFYDNRAHTYKNGSCIYCGNREGSELDRDESRERHAYNFIHLTKEELQKMKFDIIVGNPPYQLSDGGFGASAMPIYQLFVEQAKKLNPRYLAFIIPSRWFSGGKGLDRFRDEMLEDGHIKELVDFPDSSDCFPGVEIKGGVCYFIRDEEYSGKCHFAVYSGDKMLSQSDRYLNEGNAGVLIRYPEMVSILAKIKTRNEKTLDAVVSSLRPYGLRTDALKNPKKYNLPILPSKPAETSFLTIYGQEHGKRVVKYLLPFHKINSDINTINAWKVFMPRAYGSGKTGEIAPSPIIGEPQTICTETFLRVGPFKDRTACKNFIDYSRTKLFRLLVGIKKITQDGTRDKYTLVPLLDFTEAWTDEKLYKRYNLNQSEIDFINNNIKEL